MPPNPYLSLWRVQFLPEILKRMSVWEGTFLVVLLAPVSPEGKHQQFSLSLGGLGSRLWIGRGSQVFSFMLCKLFTKITCLVCMSMQEEVAVGRDGGTKALPLL